MVQTGYAYVPWETVIDTNNLGSLGEFGLIDALSSWFPAGPRTLVGIGDDAAVLATPDGRVVATTDFLIEGRHFRLDWSDATDVGHKAAARSLADIAAMGASPTGLLVALAAPPDLPVSWLKSLTSGLAAECARVGAAVIGGDTSRADTVFLAVTGLGDLAGRPPVLRAGATPGDVVAVAGPVGHAAAGLALLSATGGPGQSSAAAGGPGQWSSTAAAPDLAPLIAAQLRPAPPYDAGPEAAALGATAMIDVSDGLLADLTHIADASQVQINVRAAALADPLLRQADLITKGGSPAGLTWALTGGEDHSLAATFPPGKALPDRWRIIGEVRPGHGVLVDERPYQGPRGWDHFR